MAYFGSTIRSVLELINASVLVPVLTWTNITNKNEILY